jgi:HK97 family phage major capsid protein
VSDHIQTLVERRANIWTGMEALLDRASTEDRDFSAEEQGEWEKRNADLDALDGRIKQLKAIQDRNADIEASIRTVTSQAPAPEAPAAGTKGADLRKLFNGEMRGGLAITPDRPMGTDEFRALSKLSNGAGNYTVPTSFYDRLVEHMIYSSAVLQAGPTILNTSSGEPLQIPKTATFSSGAIVAEGGTIPTSEPTFGQVTLGAYKYGLLLQISHELVNDTAVDLEGFIARQAGRALGNAFGQHLVVGTGTAQPSGILQNATTGVTGGTGVAGAPTYANLVDLFYSVIAPYRNSPSTAWLVTDSTMGTLRKLVDAQQRPIFEPSLQAGTPDTLFNKHIYTDPYVPATGLNAKSVIFGDMAAYFVRLVEGVRLEMSSDFAFNSDLLTYRALLRGDGTLVDQTGAIKVFVGGAS